VASESTLLGSLAAPPAGPLLVTADLTAFHTSPSFSESSFCDLLPEPGHLPFSSDRSSDSATIAEESEPSIGFP
jgi:hypothetical protein